MCRLFGFRSIIQSQVHSSLVNADNALEQQSYFHPDGWGVAYYISGSPHLIKSDKTAVHDHLFKKISGVVSSDTVVAHLRKATLGSNNILNTHPFQFGSWVFAHNGNIKQFSTKKNELLKLIDSTLQRFILGDTDSELIFFIILTNISKLIPLNRIDCSFELLKTAVTQSIKQIINIIGDMSDCDTCSPNNNFLTFIITNGPTMIAHQGGKNLLYSTYKSNCTQKDTCPEYTIECEAPTKSGYINHLIFASEALQGDNVWIPIKFGQIIGTDWTMKLNIV